MSASVVWSARSGFAGIVAVSAIVASLISLAPQAAWSQAANPAVKQGQELAFDRGKGNCLACHQMAGGDLAGNVGPNLDKMKQRYPDRKELYDLIFNESKRNPQTVMPAFGTNHILTEEEINKVIDFLYSL